MSEKMVEIITCKGTVFAKFVCGLEQGNPDSPTIANLVIKMKHDVWAMLPKSLRDIIRNDPGETVTVINFTYRIKMMEKCGST